MLQVGLFKTSLKKTKVGLFKSKISYMGWKRISVIVNQISLDVWE